MTSCFQYLYYDWFCKALFCKEILEFWWNEPFGCEYTCLLFLHLKWIYWFFRIHLNFFNCFFTFWFFFILKNEHNVTNFAYVVVPRLHITHKDFQDYWTNSWRFMESIFFKNGILKNILKNGKNSYEFWKINKFIWNEILKYRNSDKSNFWLGMYVSYILEEHCNKIFLKISIEKQSS